MAISPVRHVNMNYFRFIAMAMSSVRHVNMIFFLQICNHGNVLRAPCEYDPKDRRNANRGLAGTGWPPFGEYKVITVMIMIVVMINTTNCYYLA